MLLTLDNLRVQYGSFVAIPGLTLEVGPGAIGLLGPNGAGKSSLLKALLGLVRPVGGRATVLGLDARRDGVEIRRRLGFMPETPSFFPGLTGFENVAYAGHISGMPRGEARRRAHEVLEYVQMGEERYRPVDDYSTGMRQRVKLASALVHDPDLLFLDEPTNGLDPKGRVEILELIRDLAALKGLSLILSSHLLADVEFVCRHILVLAEGRLKTSGSLDELKEAHGHRRVRLTLVRNEKAFLDRVREQGWEVELIDPLDPSDCLVTLPEGVAPHTLLGWAREVGCQVRRILPRSATLEDVFLSTLTAADADGKGA